MLPILPQRGQSFYGKEGPTENLNSADMEILDQIINSKSVV